MVLQTQSALGAVRGVVARRSRLHREGGGAFPALAPLKARAGLALAACNAGGAGLRAGVSLIVLVC